MLVRAVTLLALLLPTTGSAETALQELERMEQLWREAFVRSYTFRPHGEFNLVGDTPPVVVRVVDGRAKTITFDAAFGRYRAGQRISLRALQRMPPTPVLTVEDFFQFIRANIDPDQVAGTIRYHKTLGYPLLVYFDNPEMDDDEMLVQIKWLEVER